MLANAQTKILFEFRTIVEKCLLCVGLVDVIVNGLSVW